MVWPGSVKLAISLTYDGALPEHVEVVGPALEHFGFRGTFFVDPPKVLERTSAWQALAEAGHEIGNGSLLKVAADGRLPNWTLRMVEQDLHMTQEFLKDMFPSSGPGGSRQTSFAYPGRLPLCAQGSYRPVVDAQFAFSRSAHEGDNHPGCNVRFLRRRNVGELSNEAVSQWRRTFLNSVQDPETPITWHVLRFGGMYLADKNRELLTHELTLGVLSSVRDQVWIAPMGEIAAHVGARFGAASAL